jgi:hypothetical protein
MILARSAPSDRGGIISVLLVESTPFDVCRHYNHYVDSSSSQRGNLPMNTVIRLRPSQSEKPTVRGGRAKNADYRQREYLTEDEVEKLWLSRVRAATRFAIGC